MRGIARVLLGERGSRAREESAVLILTNHLGVLETPEHLVEGTLETMKEPRVESKAGAGPQVDQRVGADRAAETDQRAEVKAEIKLHRVYLMRK